METSNLDNCEHLSGYMRIGYKAIPVEFKPRITKPEHLTCYSRWIGGLAIYFCGGDSEPRAVFITGVNSRGTLQGQYLNSTTAFFGSVRYCIEFSPRLMDRLMFALV